MGFLRNFFLNCFDFNGDHKVDLGERIVAHNIMREITKDAEKDYAWKLTCEDGSEYGLDPEEFNSEEEYEYALEEAKSEWRDFCEDGSDIGVYPEDFDSEEEYLEELEEKKYGWRNKYREEQYPGVNPQDYETEEEYQQAIERAKYEWRLHCEDGTDYEIDPDEYETEEEYEDALEEAKSEWIIDDEGIEYGVFSEDYDTKEEYEEALYEKKYGWRNSCEDGTEYHLNPASFETERKYVKALEEAKHKSSKNHERRRKKDDGINTVRQKVALEILEYPYAYSNEAEKRSEFVVEFADRIVAAKYTSPEDGFLYCQAIRDNFNLPIKIPEEDEKQEWDMYELAEKVAEIDCHILLEVWHWCAKTFLPYKEYDLQCGEELTNGPLMFIEQEDMLELVCYMDANEDFLRLVIENLEDISNEYLEVVVVAMQHGKKVVATRMLDKGLEIARKQACKTIQLTNTLLACCDCECKSETLDFLEEKLIPEIEKSKFVTVQKKVRQWKETLAKKRRNIVRYGADD